MYRWLAVKTHCTILVAWLQVINIKRTKDLGAHRHHPPPGHDLPPHSSSATSATAGEGLWTRWAALTSHKLHHCTSPHSKETLFKLIVFYKGVWHSEHSVHRKGKRPRQMDAPLRVSVPSQAACTRYPIPASAPSSCFLMFWYISNRRTAFIRVLPAAQIFGDLFNSL